MSISNAPTNITPCAHRFGHARVLPGQHCPHKLSTFIVERPHGDQGGRTSSMGEVGGKCLQMDAGSRSKQAEAQRDPEDDLRHAGVVSGLLSASVRPLSLPFANALELCAETAGAHGGPPCACAPAVASSEDHHGEHARDNKSSREAPESGLNRCTRYWVWPRARRIAAGGPECGA